MISGAIARVPLIGYALAKGGRRIPMHGTAAPLRLRPDASWHA
jgi:hypothetical protein